MDGRLGWKLKKRSKDLEGRSDLDEGRRELLLGEGTGVRELDGGRELKKVRVLQGARELLAVGREEESWSLEGGVSADCISVNGWREGAG